MPCPNCTFENPETSRFCAQCGASLARACINCGEPLAEAAKFCPSCGAKVRAGARGSAQAEPVGSSAHERRLVTVLFADVSGSTALGERLDPERLKEVFDIYFDAMRDEIEAEGGTVEKFVGDAVMAAFGVPVAHEDDPARALRAAMAMQERIKEVNERIAKSQDVSLRIRIGVNTGEVLATADPAPGTAMVTGDAVNSAARLEQLAEPGSIVTSERTLRAARGFRGRDLGLATLEGRAAPIRAFVVESETGGEKRGVAGLRAPLVGRDTELEFLDAVFDRVAKEKRPNLVTVYGEAGVGKSRLTQEFLDSVTARNSEAAVLRGRCLPYGNGITYWPLAEILKGVAGVQDNDASDVALDKIRETGSRLLSEDLAPDPVRAAAALAYTVGLEDPDVSFADLEPRDVNHELHAAWRSFFSALAADRPTIVVIEDIHWADPALLDLLQELADKVQGPVLFVCPSRPDLVARSPGWSGGRRNVSSISLDPLTPEESDQLVRLLLAIDDLPVTVHDRILERAEGNPFFLEEIIRHLIDEGLVTNEAGRWVAGPGIEDIEIPDTVQGVLASRIDLLEPEVKQVLQAASVVGRVFWPGSVMDLLGYDSREIDEELSRLEDRDLITARLGSTMEGEHEFIFKHVLTRDVAYESLPTSHRSSAHHSVAKWIQRAAGERAPEFAELLAFHLTTAVSLTKRSGEEIEPGLRLAAFDWSLRASVDARRRQVLRKAQDLAEQALEMAGNDLERTRALEALGQAFLANYQGDLAWRYLCEAALTRANCEPADPSTVANLAARACDLPIRWPGSMRSLPGESEAKAMLDLGMENLPPGDSEERVRLLAVQAGWRFTYVSEEVSDDDLDEMVANGVEAAEMALRLGRYDLASGAFDMATGAWGSRGFYSRALPVYERRAKLLPELKDSLEITDSVAMGEWVHYELGNYTKARQLAAEYEPKIAGRGFAAGESHARAWKTLTLWRLGEWDASLAEHAMVLALLGDRRDEPPYFVVHAFAVAGMIHESRGERSQADRLVEVLAGLLEAAVASSRIGPWFSRLLVLRGETDLAQRVLDARPPTWRVHASDLWEAEAELVAATEEWDRVPALAAQMRTHATEAGCRALPTFADLLKGRSLLAAGDAEAAMEKLEVASQGFADLSAPWEKARADLDLARALTLAGREEDANSRSKQALATFESLGAERDITRAGKLMSE